MPKERGESGQYIPSVSVDGVLDTFDRVEGPPVVTSADVADATGVSRDTARRKLEGLVEQSEVDKRRTAGRVLYWRSNQNRSQSDEMEDSTENQGPEGEEAGIDRIDRLLASTTEKMEQL